MSLFIKYGSKEAGAKCMDILYLSQRVRVYEFQKGVDLRFTSSSGSAFDQGIWWVSINFVS